MKLCCYPLVGYCILVLSICNHAAPPLNVLCEIQLRAEAVRPGTAIPTAYVGKIKSIDTTWVYVQTDRNEEVRLPVSAIVSLNTDSP